MAVISAVDSGCLSVRHSRQDPIPVEAAWKGSSRMTPSADATEPLSSAATRPAATPGVPSKNRTMAAGRFLHSTPTALAK